MGSRRDRLTAETDAIRSVLANRDLGWIKAGSRRMLTLPALRRAEAQAAWHEGQARLLRSDPILAHAPGRAPLLAAVTRHGSVRTVADRIVGARIAGASTPGVSAERGSVEPPR